MVILVGGGGGGELSLCVSCFLWNHQPPRAHGRLSSHLTSHPSQCSSLRPPAPRTRLGKPEFLHRSLSMEIAIFVKDRHTAAVPSGYPNLHRLWGRWQRARRTWLPPPPSVQNQPLPDPFYRKELRGLRPRAPPPDAAGWDSPGLMSLNS